MASATGAPRKLARFRTATNLIPWVKQRQLLKVPANSRRRPLQPQPLDDEENSRHGEQTKERAVEYSLGAERYVAAKAFGEHAAGNRHRHRRDEIADHARDFRYDHAGFQ